MAAETTAISGSNAPSNGAAKDNWLTRAKDYIDDLKAEMRRVTWPSSKQVQATTAVVIISVFLFAAYFWVVDVILGNTINKIFQSLAQK